ncbi:hypothetical protein KIN20_019749 [Parelaphostrongylus tenuis]|uniref:Uncharacterized protein n=1 Tax=Parelaphostrongylus tenuis TaxID=148309 RepID=A0AAD5MLG7_PARTN|nr:hypothetical protein KIN20_019749 [Parelaphostrongylus tenuis]
MSDASSTQISVYNYHGCSVDRKISMEEELKRRSRATWDTFALLEEAFDQEADPKSSLSSRINSSFGSVRDLVQQPQNIYSMTSKIQSPLMTPNRITG